jgi:hypothetical protein
MKERGPGHQPQSEVGGLDDFIGTRLAHMRPVFRILALGHDVCWRIARKRF